LSAFFKVGISCDFAVPQRANEMEEKMSKGKYSITLDDINGIVRVVARGELVKELGEEIITKARLTAAEHKFDILCDVRHAEAIVSFADWFYLPKTLPVYKDNKTRIIKTALIISPGNQESEYYFYETVMKNEGMNLKVFLKEKEAVKWLEEGY
jgi:hypothetical protein